VVLEGVKTGYGFLVGHWFLYFKIDISFLNPKFEINIPDD